MTTNSPTPQLKYFAENELRNHFFVNELLDIVNPLYESLHGKTYVGVYPDAVYGKYGLPSGLALTSKLEDAILMPGLLQDTGCGFLTFKIELLSTPENNWQQKAVSILDELVNKKSAPSPKIKSQLQAFSMQEIALKGLDVFAGQLPDAGFFAIQVLM